MKKMTLQRPCVGRRTTHRPRPSSALCWRRATRLSVMVAAALCWMPAVGLTEAAVLTWDGEVKAHNGDNSWNAYFFDGGRMVTNWNADTDPDLDDDVIIGAAAGETVIDFTGYTNTVNSAAGLRITTTATVGLFITSDTAASTIHDLVIDPGAGMIGHDSQLTLTGNSSLQTGGFTVASGGFPRPENLLLNNGNLDITGLGSPGANPRLYVHEFVNQGTVSHRGNWGGLEKTTVRNKGTWTIQGGDSYFGGFNNPFINYSGALLDVAMNADATAFMYMPLHNDEGGTVKITSGTLELAAAENPATGQQTNRLDGGFIQVAEGAELVIWEGFHDEAHPEWDVPPATFEWSGGTIELFEPVIETSPADGAADGPPGDFPTLVKNGGEFTITEGSEKTLKNGLYLNQGTVTQLDDVHLRITQIRNEGDWVIKKGVIGGESTSEFLNLGELRHEGPDRGRIHVPVESVGHDIVNQGLGSLWFFGDNKLGGGKLVFDKQASDIIFVAENTTRVVDDLIATETGGGHGTIIIGDDFLVDKGKKADFTEVDTFFRKGEEIPDHRFGGQGVIEVAIGSWEAGILTGAGGVLVKPAAGRYFSILPEYAKKAVLEGRLENRGTIQLGGILFIDGGTVVNQEGAAFKISLFGNTEPPSESAAVGTFVNKGTLRFEASQTVMTVKHLELDNTGKVIVDGVHAVIDLSKQFRTTFLTGGTWIVDGSNAQLRLGSAASSTTIIRNMGRIELRNGGSFWNLRSGDRTRTFTNAGTFDIAGDGAHTVFETGTFTNKANAHLILENYGKLKAVTLVFEKGARLTQQPLGAFEADTVMGGEHVIGDSPGQATASGSYTLAQTGSLQIEIAGTSPGSEYDRLVVNGPVRLGGTVVLQGLNGFSAPVDTSFDVITADSIVDDGVSFAYVSGDLSRPSIVSAGASQQSLRLTTIAPVTYAGVSGSWEADPNWSTAARPTTADTAFIPGDPSNDTAVTGPASPTTVEALVIGDGDETTAAVATLQLGAAAITATRGTTIREGGLLSGDGIIAGDLFNGGTASPGTSIGQMTVNGGYRQAGDGALLIEIGPLVTQYDRLVISGTATLAGLLAVTPLPDAAGLDDVPLGTEFPILTYATRDPANPGPPTTFDTITGTVLSSSFALAPVYDLGDANGLTLIAALPGDVELDRDVDFSDFTYVAANYNQTGKSWIDGDFDGNGTVGFSDFTYLAANYGIDVDSAPGGNSDAPAAGKVELHVDQATGEMWLVGHKAALSGYSITSAAGSLIPAGDGDSDAAAFEFYLSNLPDDVSAAGLDMGVYVDGDLPLAAAYDPAGPMDLVFSYGLADRGGSQSGRIVPVPESTTLGLLALGGTIALMRRRSRKA